MGPVFPFVNGGAELLSGRTSQTMPYGESTIQTVSASTLTQYPYPA